MQSTFAIPMLPCPDIDEMGDFYRALGFEQTYRQTRPNPYLAMSRGDIHLGFFGMDGFDPSQSYGTCGLIVPDTGALYAEFAAGMRARYGKVLVSGIPRMTRPRKRANVEGRSGFSVIDPGGNWVRVFAGTDDSGRGPGGSESAADSALARAVRNAVVLADSRGDDVQAARILDAKLRAAGDRTAAAVDLAEALLLRAEIAIRQADPDTARAMIDRFEQLDPAAIDSTRSVEFAEQASTLAEQLR